MTKGKVLFTHNFVRHDKEVEFFSDRSNGLEFSLGENFAHGVVRGVDDNHLCLRSDGASIPNSEKGRGIWEGLEGAPQFFHINRPFRAGRLEFVTRGWVERNVDRDTAVECDGRKVLVEEGFEHDDFITVLEERSEYGVLSCKLTIRRVATGCRRREPSFAPLVTRISDSTSRSLPNSGL
jgi:hypothetical protein